MPSSSHSLSSVQRQKRVHTLMYALLTLLSLLCVLCLYVIYALVHHQSALPLAIFSSRSVSTQQLLDAYHPVHNAQRLQRRLKHSCHTTLPTKPQLARFRKLYPSLSRFIMYFNIHLLLDNHTRHVASSQRLQALQLGGSFSVFKSFEHKLSISETQYPNVDIHDTKLASNSFDIIGADQVMEHIAFPHLAVLEMHRLLRPGGIAIVTSCAYNPVHGRNMFFDFWRFMRDGLVALSLPFQGGILQCGTWGSPDVVATRAHHFSNSSYEQQLMDEMFETQVQTNDLDNPFQSWIVVRK
eukprot:TRINITY_DN5033_c0_g1_i1.p1 TRINITY_DN5033_c0_g1~~TRINITY_DN5033_c0_g1_i1.p1  ORF type:complete len:297 (+),score=55.47 TRINITY_DN5033_c0_g1_i1:327-1217(+)